MAPQHFMERSKGVIREGTQLVFMDNFVKRHRERHHRVNREINIALQRQAAMSEDILADPDRIARAARLEALSMDAELFGTDRADLRPNQPLPKETQGMSKAGSRFPAKNPTEVVSTADMNALLSGKKPGATAANQTPVRSLGRLESPSSSPGASASAGSGGEGAKPQQKRAKVKHMFGGFEARGGLGLDRARVRARARARGRRIRSEKKQEDDGAGSGGSTTPSSRASSAYPGAPTDPSIIPHEFIDVNRGFWPKKVRERVEAAEAARSKGAARRMMDAAEKAAETRKAKKQKEEGERKREKAEDRETWKKRAERERDEKTPSPVGRKRKAEVVEESDSDDEPVVVPTRKIRRVGKLTRE